MNQKNQAASMFGLALVALVASGGCAKNPDVAWRQRTEKQLAEIRSGEDDTIIWPFPGMLEKLAQDPRVSANLKEINSMGDVSSTDFAKLADFPNLTSVAVYDTRGTDGFLKYVRACGRVERLSIDQTDMTDDGLTTISQIATLTDLGISSYGDKLTSAALNKLAALPRLEKLRLSLGPSQPDIQALRTALPNCDIKLEVEQ